MTLGGIPGGSPYDMWANAVSADGKVVVGEGESVVGDEAFRWTNGGGAVGVGDIPRGGIGA